MAIDIGREIASLRNTPGQQWVARAFQKLQDAVNQQLSGTSQAKAPSSTITSKALYSEPVIPAPAVSSSLSSSPAKPPILVNTDNQPVGSGSGIIQVTAADSVTVTIVQVQLIYNTWVKIGDANITPSGGFILTFLDGTIYNTSDNPVTVTVAAYKNGIQFGPALNPSAPFLTAGGFASFDFTRPDADPGMLPNTYSLYAFLQLNVTNPVYIQNAQISLLSQIAAA